LSRSDQPAGALRSVRCRPAISLLPPCWRSRPVAPCCPRRLGH
jgi:hypothetical protein